MLPSSNRVRKEAVTCVLFKGFYVKKALVVVDVRRRAK